jgi:nitrous oxidase accessory protein NosD
VGRRLGGEVVTTSAPVVVRGLLVAGEIAGIAAEDAAEVAAESAMIGKVSDTKLIGTESRPLTERRL